MQLLIRLSVALSRFTNVNIRVIPDSYGDNTVVLFHTLLSTRQLFNYFPTFGYVIEKPGCKDPERIV